MDKTMIQKRLSQVIETDATMNEKYDFLATHVPFKNLKFANSGLMEMNSHVIDEESFFQEKVLDEYDNHHFIVVQGDNGSGKSHFIRWIKERYENEIDQDKEAIIFIARSQNTLKGALEQIIKSKVFTDEFREKELKKLIQANDHLSESFLKKNILHQFAIAADEDDEYTDLERRYKRRVSQLLVDETMQEYLLQENGPIDRIKAKLNSDDKSTRQNENEAKFHADDFKLDYSMLGKMNDQAARNALRLAEDLVDIKKGQELREKVAKFLNKKIELVVQNSTNLRATDLRKIFEQLRIELKKQGKNLTLFIEDITSFTGIDSALVDVLSNDNKGTDYNKSHCRIFSIVGLTTAYYKDYFEENFKERVTGRVLIDDAVLFSQKEIANMAGRYMNAIHCSSEELKNWMDEGADLEKLPIAEENLKYKWSNITLEDGKEVSIFPFNKRSLWNMYSSLDHKTPRKFLKDILKYAYTKYLLLKNFPPDPDKLKGLYKIPEWKEPLHAQTVTRQAEEDYLRVSCLLRLWGDGTAFRVEENGETTVGGLSKNVFEAFGLKFIDGVRTDGTTADAPRKETPEASGTKGSTKGRQEPKKINPNTSTVNKEDKKAKEFKKMQADLENWMKGEPLKDYIKLRDDLCDIFITFIDWQAEGVSPQLVSGFFSGKKRISIEGQVGQALSGFQVKRNVKSMYALLALAAWRILGNSSWNFENSIGHITNLSNWILNIKNDLIKSIFSIPELNSLADWKMDKWGMINEFYIKLISGKLSHKDSLTDIYNKIFTQQSKVIPETDRAKTWEKLQSLLSNKSNIPDHHDFVLNYYNCVIGDVTKNKSVYFIDVFEVLNILDDLKEIDWDINKFNPPRVKVVKNHILYQSYEMLNYLKDRVDGLIEDELDKSKEIRTAIDNILGKDHNKNDISNLFEDMRRFLEETLYDANEAFTDDEFREFLGGNMTWEKMLEAENSLIDAMECKDKHSQMLRYSSHPIKAIRPYLDLLRNMNTLVNSKRKKYKDKMEEIKDKNKDVDEVIDEIQNILLNMKSRTQGINKGGR